ncbi:hypothetical protein E4U53_003718, partial [Claviceps sorghi]
ATRERIRRARQRSCHRGMQQRDAGIMARRPRQRGVFSGSGFSPSWRRVVERRGLAGFWARRAARPPCSRREKGLV